MSTTKRWNYVGDVSLRHGGFFWREDGEDDYVLCVDVTPCSDAGGPDNLFWIEEGSVYLPAEEGKRKAALDCIDSNLETATRAEVVYAFKAYAGIDKTSGITLRIGKPEKGNREWGGPDRADVVLRAGSSLRNYVKREFLHR